MNLDPAFLKQLTLISTGFAVAFLAALWLSLIFWAFRDIRNRTRDPFMRVLVVVVMALLFLPGILIYLILRPARTLEEEYQKSLEEEALLQTIEESAHCPGCNRHVHAEWLVCPACHTQLKKKCVNCNKTIDLPWNLCPWCETPVSGMPKEASVVLQDKDAQDGRPFQHTLLEDEEFQSHP